MAAYASAPGNRLLATGYSRHPSDLVRLGLGSALVLASAVPINGARIGPWETDVFRLVNDLPLPGFTYPAVWLVMQLGVIGAVPIVALLALATRRLRLALDAVLAAGSIYLIARVIKEFVKRGRPQSLLDQVHILGEPARGLGYVSGHSAVAVALATVASPYLGRRWRRVAWALAVCVCLARMYVGAHLPLDVLGGAALGWVAGAIVHLVLGAPDPRPSAARVARAMAEHGIELDAGALAPVGPFRRRSSHFVANGYFAKVVSREWRDTDLIYRAWRTVASLLRHWRFPRGGHGSPLGEVEHEAAMALLARRGGVRVPEVVLACAFGNGAGLLVQRRVDGHTLAEAGEPGPELAAELWRQLELLHAAGLVHGQLGPDNVLVDAGGEPWLVDFDQAEVTTSEVARSADSAALAVAAGERPRVWPEVRGGSATPRPPEPGATSWTPSP